MKLLTFILALLLSAQSLEAPAEAYPSKPIRLVIPFAAGSATDAAGRILAQALSQRLGQSVVVDNRAGANGQIAAMLVAQSPADGYTLFMTTNSTHSANPHLYKSLPYDPVKDFEPIARVGTLAFMLVVNPELPVGTPQPIVARLAHETLASLAQSDVKDRLAAIGFEVEPLDTVAFGRYVREQLDTWGKLIRAAKIQPE